VRTPHASEIVQRERFAFGQNWRKFLGELDDRRIAVAERSLKEMLDMDNLRDLRFLDIGSGSGLFSLAARRLGASVHSFDYDPQSVACTAEIKRRYFPDDSEWIIEEGSVLDEEYMASLGQFDTVYAWGVLHHTGSMWQALENASSVAAPGGRLFIAIYNDEGRASQYWKTIKRMYNRLPRSLRFLLLWPVLVRLFGPRICRDLLSGRPFASWQDYCQGRGMSPWRDVVDWVGGYPFEVATPGAIFEFCHKKNFKLVKLQTTYGFGCNEFVFVRSCL
jgi:2-polyprenyl-6-hydroxyphenyl methylase/3-demethylubiquinone-9 3-methyltransferase